MPRWPRSRRAGIAVGRADRLRLGPHRPGRPGQRAGHAVVPRRHHRGGHRGTGGAGRPHRAQGALGPRRLVGRRAPHPARVQARPDQAHRARGADRGGRGAVQRRGHRPGQRPARGDHLRGRRSLGLAAGPGRRQLRPGRASTPGDFWHFARVQVLAAARAAGIDAIDAPYPAYQDPEGYRRSAVHASLLGFDGKWAIHPDQIPIANEVFAPTAEEIAEARAVHRDLPHAPRPRASAPSGATASWWMPPTCGWRPTCSTRPSLAGRTDPVVTGKGPGGGHDRADAEPYGWSSGPPATSGHGRCAASSSTPT